MILHLRLDAILTESSWLPASRKTFRANSWACELKLRGPKTSCPSILIQAEETPWFEMRTQASEAMSMAKLLRSVTGAPWLLRKVKGPTKGTPPVHGYSLVRISLGQCPHP